jgi:hypothetical protein
MKNKPARIRIDGIYKKNDRIIWDSGYGYELAIFVGESPEYNSYTIELYTGNSKGSFISVDVFQVKHYTPKLSAELAEKYGCKHRTFKNIHIQKN